MVIWREGCNLTFVLQINYESAPNIPASLRIYGGKMSVWSLLHITPYKTPNSLSLSPQITKRTYTLLCYILKLPLSLRSRLVLHKAT